MLTRPEPVVDVKAMSINSAGANNHFYYFKSLGKSRQRGMPSKTFDGFCISPWLQIGCLKPPSDTFPVVGSGDWACLPWSKAFDQLRT